MENSYNPYTSGGYQQRSAYPTYDQNYGSAYNYQGYHTQYVVSANAQPVGGGDYSHLNWSSAGYGQPVTETNVPPPSASGSGGQNDAVAHEIKQQKAQLLKQREDYVRKVLVLKRELELLRNQKHDLMTGNSPPRDLESIVKENEKLQEEIQSKMKAITNVIEMLSSIIKDGLKLADLETQLRRDETPKKPRAVTKSPSAPPPAVENSPAQFNYVHYDPELHWCRMCDKFPKTAKEFLQHLQGKKHQDNIHENDVSDNTPWHKLPAEPELPHFEGAPKKRIPIKGLQFFISAPSWYCKLCDIWIGDLHCASQHLKSQVHFQNYQNFVEQNPHWEMEWLKDREKALQDKGGSSDSDDETHSKKKKKRKDKRASESKDKKRKKHSKKRKKHSSDTSSSSSNSDSSSDENDVEDKSKSIRVAMRNVKVESIMNEDLGEKWEMLGRLVEEHKKKEKDRENKKAAAAVASPSESNPNDPLISQWMTVNQPQEREKYLLDSLKDRMKQKHDMEKAKYAEMDRKQKERELREKEEYERKQREEKDTRERMERERKERERQEYERIIDKDNRDQVKFKQTFREKYYRKRHTPSPSPERKRSPSPPVPTYSRKSPSNRYNRHSRENGGNQPTPPSRRSRSRSPERKSESSSHNSSSRRKPPGPPSYKKLPFIGRMPLFKNRKPDDNKVEKEIKKEEYDKPRPTRFQPGHLARSFIPEPEVVCFPRLTTYPELIIPPAAIVPPKVVAPVVKTPPKPAAPPPPPKVEKPKEQPKKEAQQQQQPEPEEFDPSMYEDPSETLKNYYTAMEYSMGFTQLYDYPAQDKNNEAENVPISHMMPLQPPPLPPGEDDLALLGISADDMAAQRF